MLIVNDISVKSLLLILLCWSWVESTDNGQLYDDLSDSGSGSGMGQDPRQKDYLEIIPDTKEIELESNSTFRITCKSSQTIEWYWSREDGMLGPVNDIPKGSIATLSNGPDNYCSILTIRNASAKDVRMYGCRHSDSYLDSVQIYVYVKDYKTELVPVENQRLFRTDGTYFRIPCKPSYPKVRIELYKKCWKTLAWLPVESYKHDEHYGFYIFKPGVQSEEYMCRVIGKSNSVLIFDTPEGNTYLTSDDFGGPKNASIMSLSIKNNVGAYVTKGEIIRVSCSISFKKNTEIHTMFWILPNTQLAKNDSRTNVTFQPDFPTTDHEEYLTRTMYLTVANAMLQNSGKYICEVKFYDENLRRSCTNNRRTDVTVLHGNESFADLTVIKALTSSNVSENSQVKIVVDYSVYPETTFYWTKDEELLNGHKYTNSKNHESVTLTISNATFPDDVGEYTLHVENRNETVTQQVYIRGISDLTMEVDGLTAVCSVTAYPTVTILFKYIHCDHDTFAECSEDAPIIVSPVSIKNDGNFYESAYLITHSYYQTPDYAICEATNSDAALIVRAPLWSPDLKDVLTLTRDPSETDIFVGDRVIFLCTSDGTNNITFKHNGVDQIRNIGNVVFRKYNLVYLKQLTIDNITENDQGIMECEACDTDYTESHEMGSPEFYSRSMTLIVHKPLKPKIHDSAPEGNAIELLVGRNYEMKCNATGMPKPSVEWFKNNQPLNFNKSSIIYFRENDTSLLFEDLNLDDTGYYTCKAKNRFGNDTHTWMLKVISENSSPTTVWIQLGLLVLVLLMINCVILVLYWKKRKENSTLKQIGLSQAQRGYGYILNPEMFLNDQTDYLSYKDEYEFPKDKLKLGEQLGTGHFGVVVKAIALGIMSHEDETTVAIKMIKTRGNIEEMRALVSELKIMIHIGHHLNVVNLLGAVTKNVSKNQLMVIVEYCSYGNVADYLGRHRSDFINLIQSETDIIATINCNGSTSDPSSIRQPEGSIQAAEDGTKGRSKPKVVLTTTDLVSWAAQVACGMDYLVSKNVLHGDLAARNILLSDGNVVKICDFGLAQAMRADRKCKKQSDQMLPIKWLALECIETNTFGTASDIWAYGVMLWEFFSLAKVPYLGIKKTEDIFSKLMDGYRLECPEYANPEIFTIMLKCWNVDPDRRPTFKNLSTLFNAMLPQETNDYYMKLNDFYMAMNVGKTNKLETDDSLTDLDGVPQERIPPLPFNTMETTL